MPDKFGPYSDWRSRELRCPCGWTGKGSDAATEHFRDLFEVNCPKCDARFGLVSHPTFDEVRREARAGNAAAQRDLVEVEAAERTRAEFLRTCLTSPAQLPDLDGDAIELVWDAKGECPDASYLIKRCEQVIWREMAYWEDWERVAEVEEILGAKYGSRLKSLRFTRGAVSNLAGDSITGYGKLAARELK